MAAYEILDGDLAATHTTGQASTADAESNVSASHCCTQNST